MRNSFRTTITRAFVRLRRQGYFCRSNFGFSVSAGWDLITWEQAEKAVFYTYQDRLYANHGSIYLAWSGDAQEICDALRDEGLMVEHDGSKDVRIKVLEV